MSCVKDVEQLKAFERFMLKVVINPKGCWEWQGGKNKDGYGQFSFRDKWMQAHRWVYMFVHGEIPEGEHVLHSCDNPGCVSPLHLSTGTHAENMRQMVDRGRSAIIATTYKMSDKDAANARRMVSHGVKQAEVARRYGVSRQTIYLICKGKLHKPGQNLCPDKGRGRLDRPGDPSIINTVADTEEVDV